MSKINNRWQSHYRWTQIKNRVQLFQTNYADIGFIVSGSIKLNDYIMFIIFEVEINNNPSEDYKKLFLCIIRWNGGWFKLGNVQKCFIGKVLKTIFYNLNHHHLRILHTNLCNTFSKI